MNEQTPESQNQLRNEFLLISALSVLFVVLAANFLGLAYVFLKGGI